MGGMPSMSASTSVASHSGDAKSSQTTPFVYNGSFQIGGHGSGQAQVTPTTQDTGTPGTQGGGVSPLVLAVGGAVLLLAVVLVTRAPRAR